MKNCLCIILFLVLSLTIPVTSAYAYGGDGDGDGDEIESTSSDTTNPPSGFTPVEQESAEITTSSETDPGKEEEVAELVEDVNAIEDTTEEGDIEGDSADSDEDQGDNTNQEIETAVADIDPHGSAPESGTTKQQDPGQNLIGTQGTLPGTRNATLDNLSTEINEDGSVTTWADYSNDTWVCTTVNPDGTKNVIVHLPSGTMIRPGQEYIHTGGSLNPLLDLTIGILEGAAAAGTVAGWVLTVTPAGALASGGIKAGQATWAATVGIQAVRAGTDVYGQEIDKGATQSEAVWAGTKQTAANAVVTTATGTFLADPYKDAIGEVTGEVGHAIGQSAINQLANVEAAGLTEAVTGTNPGYGPGLF